MSEGARTIVAVDVCVDVLTATVASFREATVYPLFTTPRFQLTRFTGDQATHAIVGPVLQQPETAYFTGSGHGDKDSFPSGESPPVLRVDTYHPDEVRGKIVHLLSCSTGTELGADLVRNGARAFFGYNERFFIPMSESAVFLACASQVDRCLAGGLSAGEAHDQTVAQFEQDISRFRSLGKHDEAGYLKRNLRCFCSPSLHPAWGDPAARL